MISDMTDKIKQRIYGHGRGWVFNPKDFMDIAGSDSIRQTLSRLTKRGTIRRIAHGIYDYPINSDLLDKPIDPAPQEIAQAIARAHGWTITPTGDTAMNILGLSTQVPAHYQYLSDGPSKTYRWTNGTLHFKHRTNKETTSLSAKTALLVQALKAMGEGQMEDSYFEKLRREFTREELKTALREAKYSTTWVYESIKRLRDYQEIDNA